MHSILARMFAHMEDTHLFDMGPIFEVNAEPLYMYLLINN